MYLEGIEILDVHRGNYNDAGPAPKQLQLIWWEFPAEHWTALREGSRMNFMRPPDSVIHPNGAMDDEQLQVAAVFIDELIDLKIVRDQEEGRKVLATAPIFVVTKEGQPGQWRGIANMLSGGQNACMVSDPTVLPHVSHMIQTMYRGGWSAVVDASKFFYQFKTHPDDQP